MSQPRRRRRRRRKAQGTPQAREQSAQQQRAGQSSGAGRPRRRRRARGRTAAEKASASPKSSEDLVRALDRKRPTALTAPPDGQTLEQLIGELQSIWGVPQYPQEFRITLKVADDKDARPERAVVMDDLPDEKSSEARPSLGATALPRREKAPAAPRVGPSGEGGAREKASRRRRRGRRRRRDPG